MTNGDYWMNTVNLFSELHMSFSAINLTGIILRAHELNYKQQLFSQLSQQKKYFTGHKNKINFLKMYFFGLPFERTV